MTFFHLFNRKIERIFRERISLIHFSITKGLGIGGEFRQKFAKLIFRFEWEIRVLLAKAKRC